ASVADTRIGKKKESAPVKNHVVPAGSPSTDKGWKDALVLENFTLIPPGGTPKQKTVARLLSDKENLYLQFSCYEKDMEALQPGDEKVLGKIATGDCVEVFLDVTGEKKRFYHLFVNPDGGKLLLDPKMKTVENPDWQVTTSKHDDRWDVDIRIPFASLEGARTQWGINLARHNPHDKENSCTALVVDKNFSDVARYDQFAFPAGSALSASGKAVAKEIK
ncbi:MAG: carbohydrate-binding family 9-like protein, partial [Chthoniobacterales bacterium]